MKDRKRTREETVMIDSSWGQCVLPKGFSLLVKQEMGIKDVKDVDLMQFRRVLGPFYNTHTILELRTIGHGQLADFGFDILLLTNARKDVLHHLSGDTKRFSLLQRSSISGASRCVHSNIQLYRRIGSPRSSFIPILRMPLVLEDGSWSRRTAEKEKNTHTYTHTDTQTHTHTTHTQQQQLLDHRCV